MDYEALGRYTEFKDKIEKLAKQRRALFTGLSTAFQIAAGDGGQAMDLRHFDAERIDKTIAEAKEVDRLLTEAVHEANVYAERASKPKFKLHGKPAE